MICKKNRISSIIKNSAYPNGNIKSHDVFLKLILYGLFFKYLKFNNLNVLLFLF